MRRMPARRVGIWWIFSAWVNEGMNEWINKSCPGYFTLPGTFVDPWSVVAWPAQTFHGFFSGWIWKTCSFRICIHFQKVKQRSSALMAGWEDDKFELACRHCEVLISCGLFALVATASCLSAVGSVYIEYHSFNFWDMWVAGGFFFFFLMEQLFGPPFPIMDSPPPNLALPIPCCVEKRMGEYTRKNSSNATWKSSGLEESRQK